MAARLLRVNILSPITGTPVLLGCVNSKGLTSRTLVQPSIHARLDAVEELINSEDRFNYVRDALKALNKMDLDKLIIAVCTFHRLSPFHSSILHPNTACIFGSQGEHQSKASIPTGVPDAELAECCCASPGIEEGSGGISLNAASDPLRGKPQASQRAIGRLNTDVCTPQMISDERLALIERLVNANLNEETSPSKVSLHNNGLCRSMFRRPCTQGGIGAINARVYAVRANQNRLLDVARETYKENVGDIYQLNRSLSQQHDLPLVLVYQDTGGFVFSLKKDQLEGELPAGFINVVAKKGKYTFSSMDLVWIKLHLRNCPNTNYQ
jgi:DNA mismatch repair protein MSH4